MSRDMSTLVQAELTKLTPQITPFDGRLNQMIATVRSMVAQNSDSADLYAAAESDPVKIRDNYLEAIFSSSDPLPSCGAAARSVRAGHSDVGTLVEHATVAREVFVKKLIEGIPNADLRPFVQRLLELSPIEEAKGLPQLIGKRHLIVQSRLHRGNLIDLLKLAKSDDAIQGRGAEILASRFVETWMFGSGWFDFSRKDPRAMTTSKSGLPLLDSWLQNLGQYTVKAVAEVEAAHGVSLLTDDPLADNYARWERIDFILTRSRNFELICRADNRGDLLALLKECSPEWRIAKAVRNTIGK